MLGLDVPLTHLLALAGQGERGALDRVFEVLYPELRKIAHARLYKRDGLAQLDTTALVHESFLRLVDSAQLVLNDRKHFFAYAAKTMRNIIIDSAREQLAERRGSGAAALQIDTEIVNEIGAQDGGATLIRVNDALLALEAVDAELARVVEMRYFAGFSETEIAGLLGTSERTVRRQWDKARTFLLATLRE